MIKIHSITLNCTDRMQNELKNKNKYLNFIVQPNLFKFILNDDKGKPFHDIGTGGLLSTIKVFNLNKKHHDFLFKSQKKIFYE